ncbi:hypothetical protein JK386_03585 [Nocardioides sp. zg-536]|uniref:ASCH domain-containing protein n=1 Tax=Nocardioides faecalis TaxID=2803858 RepID=A0A938XYT0_9ACTN|nr:hypothetical protein [Nocardioides faecalis]MBM9458972.1 hypothetical protein [Nocardioides faecalis]MBS4753926.1 hypothetical protein [Nocardioides faecalis]QVI60366.1 hypothetical protein KG111_08845 [Nocardioides faecalis]
MSDTESLVAAFWEVAKRRARLSSLPGYFGPSALESLAPPAWSFGDSADGEALLTELLASGSLTSEVPLSDYTDADEALPETGTLGILLDGAGAPVALVVTDEVQVSTAAAGETVSETLRVVYRA